MKVAFYFDPVCPWCWTTAEWIMEVRNLRPITIDWRPFSLALKNRGGEQDERWASIQAEGLRALRVIEWARAEHGPESVESLYIDLATRWHEEGDRRFDFNGACHRIGIGPAPNGVADSEEWDPVIEKSMSEALDVVGDDVGVPILVFDDSVGLYGPILAPAPQADEAVRLFDTTVGLARTPGFFELKRSRRSGAPRKP